MNDTAHLGRSHPGWQDRLPGIALALAINAALFALLVFSLVPPPPPPPSNAARETILFLPRLPQAPPREPVIIDARPEPAPPVPATPAAPPSDWSPPLYATPQFDLPYAPPIPGSDRALLSALNRALNCVPDEKGRLSPLCPKTYVPTPAERAMAVRPPARNEARFAAEKACADGPTVLPGGSPLGILANIFTNPSSLASKGSYCPPPPPPRVDSVERQEQILRRISPPLAPEPGRLPER